MSTFFQDEEGSIAALTRSPIESRDIAVMLSEYKREKGKFPQTVRFLAWPGTDVLKGSSFCFHRSTALIPGYNLWVHELIPGVRATYVSLGLGPPKKP